MDTNDLEEKFKSVLSKLKAEAVHSDKLDALSQMFDNLVDRNKSQMAIKKELQAKINELLETKKELQSQLKVLRNED